MLRVVRSTAAVVLVVAALSGCSLIAAQSQTPPTTEATPTQSADAGGGAGSGADGQTAQEACDLLIPILTDANDRMSEAFSTLQSSGPEAMSPLLQSLNADLHDSLDQITNPEVNEVFGAFVDSVDTLSGDIDDLLAGKGDQDALFASSQDVNDKYQAITPVCQAAY